VENHKHPLIQAQSTAGFHRKAGLKKVPAEQGQKNKNLTRIEKAGNPETHFRDRALDASRSGEDKKRTFSVRKGLQKPNEKGN